MNNQPVESANMVYVGSTGDNPNAQRVWVGDFPPWDQPYQPIIQPIAPPGIIPGSTWPLVNSWSTITLSGPSSPWKLTYREDHIEAEIDVPGCKAENIELSLCNGTLSVKAHRKNSGGYSSFDTHIGPDYDPESAEAAVEDGVLTVKVMRFKDKVTHRIVVRKK